MLADNNNTNDKTNNNNISDYDSSAYSSAANLSTSSLSNCSSISSTSSLSVPKSPTLEKMIPALSMNGYAVKFENDETLQFDGNQQLGPQAEVQQQQLQQHHQVSQQVLQQLGFNIYDDNLIDINYENNNNNNNQLNSTSCASPVATYSTVMPYADSSNEYTHKLLSMATNDSNLYIDDDFILHYLNPPTDMTQNIAYKSPNASSLSSNASTLMNMVSPPPSHIIDSNTNTSSTASLLTTVSSPQSDLNYMELRDSSTSNSATLLPLSLNAADENLTSTYLGPTATDGGICFKFEYTFENEKLIQVQPPPHVAPLIEPISVATSFDSTDEDCLNKLCQLSSASSSPYDITTSTMQQQLQTDNSSLNER